MDNLLKLALLYHGKFGLNILFSDGKDPSICGAWKHWQAKPQTKRDIQLLYNRVGDEATAFGVIAGFNGLQPFDFDWPWVYRLWARDFGARTETLTVRTVNGGFRPLFFSSSPVTVSEFKETLHVKLWDLDSMSSSMGGLGVKMVKWASMLLLRICPFARTILLLRIR